MPSIIETIREYDEDILSMIAEDWGIDLQLKAGKDAAEQIAALISQKQMMAEIFNALSGKTMQTIRALVEAKGKIPWDQFTRINGEMREMGAARRERERPDRTPISVTETLFYKAIIGRAFFETSQGLREFAFIPEEFYDSLMTTLVQNEVEKLNPVADAQIEKKLLTNDHIIDQASTVLAGLRNGIFVEALEVFTPGIPVTFLTTVLKAAGIITGRLELSPELVKQFLEAARPTAMAQLAKAWQFSPEIDELELIETLIFEGQRKNKPLSSRTSIIAHINKLPDESWVTLDDFCDWILRRHPDLLRSGGEYDAWFVKNSGGDNIRGFENWQNVEGSYIRMMLKRPLFWMGFVDLGKTRDDSNPTVFRKSKWFNALIAGEVLNYPVLQKKDFEIEKSGKIIIDRFFPRDIRYQIARCCDWESVRGHKFFYRLSPQAFARMEKQGLKISQLAALINRFARKPVPENILDVLERWNKNGREAEIGTTLVVKVKSSQLLDKLMETPTKKFILNRLNATTAEISSGSAPYIKAALLEMGILAEIMVEV